MSTLKVNAIQNTSGTNILGKILQVVQVTKTDTQTSTTAATWIDVTGLSASITPTSSSSKILVHVTLNGSCQINMFARLVRGATAIAVGDVASNRVQHSIGSYYQYGDGNINHTHNLTYLDSPATTSTTTYKIQFWCSTGNTVVINRCVNDTDNNDTGRGFSSIVLMEVSG